MIEINDDLSIPEDELSFSVARSGGPGGQHVNKVSTRVTLRFDVDASPSLGEAQKRRLRARLATRIGRNGVLRVVCGRHRSQTANRREAVVRFQDLVREALARRRRRKPTAVPRTERERRLENKRRRSRLKRERTGRSDED